MPNCSICEKPAIARRLCRSHYYRAYRRGLTTLEVDERTRPLKDRLLEKITINSDGCWLFDGALRRGYGLIWVNRKNQMAHRISYGLFCGPVKEDDVICHSCDVPRCINPKHLFKGTRVDNNKDMRVKGRQACGSNCGTNSKLTEADVSFILSSREPQVDLARRFGVVQSQISRIKSGRRWKHMTK